MPGVLAGNLSPILTIINCGLCQLHQITKFTSNSFKTSISTKFVVMKNYLLKTLACLLFGGMLLSATARQSQSTAPKVTDKQIKDANANTVAALVNSVDAAVKLTDDQKTKLQAALLDVITRSEEARHAMKDDSNLQAWREQKVTDIKAQLKAILTPAQYDEAIKKGSN
jgi:hypothetical protein